MPIARRHRSPRVIVVENVLTVPPDDNLNTALRRFTLRNIGEVPVLGSSKPHSLLDMLHRKETIAFYNQR